MPTTSSSASVTASSPASCSRSRRVGPSTGVCTGQSYAPHRTVPAHLREVRTRSTLPPHELYVIRRTRAPPWRVRARTTTVNLLVGSERSRTLRFNARPRTVLTFRLPTYTRATRTFRPRKATATVIRRPTAHRLTALRTVALVGCSPPPSGGWAGAGGAPRGGTSPGRQVPFAFVTFSTDVVCVA